MQSKKIWRAIKTSKHFMKELMIPLKTESKFLLCEQIYQYIREEIKGSQMQCDIGLPLCFFSNL